MKAPFPDVAKVIYIYTVSYVDIITFGNGQRSCYKFVCYHVAVIITYIDYDCIICLLVLFCI